MMPQLILHLIGDYVTQSDWMADNKTKRFAPAAAHAVVYSLPFLLLRPSVAALLVILVTHFLIDRYRLARFVVYTKNILLSPYVFAIGDEMGSMKWSNCSATGYPSEKPAWLAVWLLIAADNTLHLTLNYLALSYL
jgi:hypothetical protein